MSEPQKFDPQCFTREDIMEAMRLQNELVSHLWENLNEMERELYTKIIDDPINIHVNKIINLSFLMGLKMRLKHLQPYIDAIVNSNIEAGKTIFRLSAVIAALLITVVGLLGYIIIIPI